MNWIDHLNLPDLDEMPVGDPLDDTFHSFKHIRYTYKAGQMLRVCQVGVTDYFFPVTSLEDEYLKDMQLVQSGEVNVTVPDLHSDDPNDDRDLDQSLGYDSKYGLPEIKQ